MNVRLYRIRNAGHRVASRLTHPWPIYKKSGGIDAVVIRANGKREDLGRVSTTYQRRWGVGAR